MAAHFHPLNPLERAYGVTNIKSHIPIILDIDDHNYDAWRELFLTHCQSFDVSGHLDGTLLPDDADDVVWTKRDGLVKLWIYGTLSKNLFRTTFKTGGTSREIWTRIENFFRNNKEARALQLDHDLRTKEIGDLTIHNYCQELKSISDLLTNVDAPVSERTLVTYMLNGLSSKYDNIINVIKHRQPFPSFDDARSMLLLEEDRLNKGNKGSLAHKDTSSSDKVLVATTAQTDQRVSSTQQSHQRFNQNRGKKQGRGRGRGNNNQRPSFPQWNAPFWNNGYPMWPMQQMSPWGQAPQYQYPQQGLLGPRPSAAPIQNQVGSQNNDKPVPTVDFAAAFNTMTLMDPTDNQWYMDSGATAHLANSAGNLTSVLNSSTGKSVMVANGSRIPIQNTGSFSLASYSRPLTLNTVLVTPSIIKNLISVRKFTKDNSCSIEFDPFGFSVKDLQTGKKILRSDSTGDLYPVLPSTNKVSAHSAFLTTSSSVWHQRLAHPSPQTLQFLISTFNLPCNKKDHSKLCNACQLGKQIKLPFSNSVSNVTEPFKLFTLTCGLHRF